MGITESDTSELIKITHQLKKQEASSQSDVKFKKFLLREADVIKNAAYGAYDSKQRGYDVSLAFIGAYLLFLGFTNDIIPVTVIGTFLLVSGLMRSA